MKRLPKLFCLLSLLSLCACGELPPNMPEMPQASLVYAEPFTLTLSTLPNLADAGLPADSSAGLSGVLTGQLVAYQLESPAPQQI